MTTKSSFKLLSFIGVFIVVTVVLILFKSTAGEKIPSLNKAVSLAKNQTPLVSVIKNDVTPPGPRKRVIYGTDAEGKELAVWVRKVPNKPVYIYLKSGVTEQDILAEQRILDKHKR